MPWRAGRARTRGTNRAAFRPRDTNAAQGLGLNASDDQGAEPPQASQRHGPDLRAAGPPLKATTKPAALGGMLESSAACRAAAEKRIVCYASRNAPKPRSRACRASSN